MSDEQAPYDGPPAAPPYPPVPHAFPPPEHQPRPEPCPRRTRPSGWWFAAGGVCLVAAVAAGVGLFLWTLGGLFDIEDTVVADGATHTITLTGEQTRMVWGRSEDGTDCTIVDTETGDEVDYSPISGTLTKQDSSGTWTGVVNFEPGSGRLEVTCIDAGGASVQIGPANNPGSFIGRIFATILVPLVLGGIGLLVILVTAVRFATGEPRRAR